MPEAKTIVITGCTRGLGRAMSEAFTQAGHTVYGCGTRADLVAQLGESLGAAERFSVVDVTDAQAVQQWVGGILSASGLPDYILSNAALINQNVPFWEVSCQEFDRMIDVNLKGVGNVARAFLPEMVKAGRGVLVNFSSGWGQHPAGGAAAYCCTKFGVEGLTRSIAQELPQGVAAIALSPGIIDTDMLRRTLGEADSAHYDSPQAWVARAVPYILGLSAEHNGQSLRIPD